jgi:hypothetical protein
MRTLLKFLVGPQAGWLPTMLLVFWALAVLPAALWALGAFARSGLDADEQTALSRAFSGGDPIVAIGAARVLSESFGNEMQDAIAASSAMFDRSGVLDPSAATLESGDSAKRAWVRRYVCGLEGWGEHRPLVRTLMLNGLGRCSGSARLWARSPILDGAPPIAGWLFFPLLVLLLLAPPLLAFLLWKVRSAYHWLYSSSVIKPSPPQVTD